MGDIGYNDIGCIHHIFISLPYSKTQGCFFQSRIQGPIIQRKIVFAIKIGDHQDGFDFRVSFLFFGNNFCRQEIELPVSAQKELLRTFGYQMADHNTKLFFNPILRIYLAVSAKGNNHFCSTPYF